MITPKLLKERDMRKIGTILLAALLVAASGCGVWMNATYSEILDRTVALSAETASRAEHGNLSPDDARQALVLQAKTWKLFQDARDGKSTAMDPPSPASAAAPSVPAPADTTPPPAVPPVAQPAAAK